MKKSILSACFVFLLLTGAFGQKYEHVGSAFEINKPVEAPDLAKTGSTNPGSEVQVTGEVESVCQVSGCWMKIKMADGQTMRVTFKDYGFFVPKDLTGTKVVFKGEPKIATTSVAALRHYAEDAGKSKAEIESINEPKTELTFVADGVLIPVSR